MGLSGPLFSFFFSFLFYTIDQCWDSNRGSLVSEVTAMPTVSQPLTFLTNFCSNVFFLFHRQGLLQTLFWFSGEKFLNIKPFILFKRASFSLFPSFLHHANDRFKDKLKGDIGIPTADIWFWMGPLCQLRHFLPSSETIVFLLFFFCQSLFQKSFILALFVQVFHVFR